MQLELNDLEAKVLRLTEQSTQHAAHLGILPTVSERIELAENQVLRWRHRLPDLTNDDDQQSIVTAVEVQEQLNRFQESTRSKIHDVSQEIDCIERQVGILEIARRESWKLISQ